MENIGTVTMVLLIIIMATHAAGTLFTLWFYVIKRHTNVSFVFAWYDVWIGGYYDYKKRIYYWMPVPMIGFKFEPQGDTTA